MRCERMYPEEGFGRCRRSPDRLFVHAGKDEEHIFEAEMVVHGAGRVPNIEGLDLKAGKISVDKNGIAINQHLQSVSNPSVYVAGDSNARGKPLSPVATMDGRTAAKNMIGGNTLTTDYRTVPQCSIHFSPARIRWGNGR